MLSASRRCVCWEMLQRTIEVYGAPHKSQGDLCLDDKDLGPRLPRRTLKFGTFVSIFQLTARNSAVADPCPETRNERSEQEYGHAPAAAQSADLSEHFGDRSVFAGTVVAGPSPGSVRQSGRSEPSCPAACGQISPPTPRSSRRSRRLERVELAPSCLKCASAGVEFRVPNPYNQQSQALSANREGTAEVF